MRYICEKPKVKEMGPADHIRTKHEVKAFVESGERTAAEIVQRAQARRTEAQVRAIRQAQQQGQNISSE